MVQKVENSSQPRCNQAIILAAGLGTRLKPITDNCPKPLLPIAGKPLIVYHLEALERAGITNVVIHLAYLSDMIVKSIGNGTNWGLNLNIKYSICQNPLESGGGLKYSLPYLESKITPFISINSDILTNYNYCKLLSLDLSSNLGHFVLVQNPQENHYGDYDIMYNEDKILLAKDFNKKGVVPYQYTYTGIALYNTELMKYYTGLEQDDKFSIIQVINQHLPLMTASVHDGIWHDIGSVDRYNKLK